MSNANIVAIIVLVGVAVVGGAFLLNNSSSPDNGENTSATNSRSVTMTDDQAQVMDTPKQTPDAMEQQPMEKSNTIVDKAIELEMTTLVEAVQAAGLVETLSSEGPFTVFVPTQQAFDDIAPTLAEIQASPDAGEQLADILTYHVVPGKVMAADVVDLTSATTVQGTDVSITVTGNTVMINDAEVVQTDVVVDNGVIHVIDSVLIPHSN